jgi:putative N6-adenine-specific DNA methylase
MATISIDWYYSIRRLCTVRQRSNFQSNRTGTGNSYGQCRYGSNSPYLHLFKDTGIKVMRFSSLQRFENTQNKKHNTDSALFPEVPHPTTGGRSKKIKRQPTFSSCDQSTFSLFASCLPGLEPYLHNELVSLGFSPNIARGGVHFKANSVHEILQCHLHLGTSSHIYLRAGPPFRALGMEELCLKVSRMKFWKEYINVDGGIRDFEALPNLDIKVTSKKSRLFHTKGIAERVERGIWNSIGVDGQAVIDKMLQNPGRNHRAKNETVKVLVRIHRNEVEISVDTSCSPLHKRGYRLEGGKAPLREDLAFSLLYSAGYSCGALLDPFCGSGTILIEGAAMAFGLPPGRLRRAPMSGSRLRSEIAWKSLVDSTVECAYENIEKQGQNPTINVFGSDRNEGAINAAQRNAERAGLLDFIKLETQAVSAVDWFQNPDSAPSRLLVATNPPFGRRISKNANKSLLPLYQTLGHKVGNMPNSVDFSILAHDATLARQTCIRNLNLQFSTKHGGLNVSALHAKDVTVK